MTFSKPKIPNGLAADRLSLLRRRRFGVSAWPPTVPTRRVLEQFFPDGRRSPQRSIEWIRTDFRVLPITTTTFKRLQDPPRFFYRRVYSGRVFAANTTLRHPTLSLYCFPPLVRFQDCFQIFSRHVNPYFPRSSSGPFALWFPFQRHSDRFRFHLFSLCGLTILYPWALDNTRYPC